MTSHAEFDTTTEALEVARAFPRSIQGKNILLTGVNLGGIGFATAEALASQSPANLILAGRTASKVQECIDNLQTRFPDVKYRFLQVDLSTQAAVRKAAAQVLGWDDIPAIDVLINSAGVMCIPEKTITEDGVEIHFATNHIGHFLLTCLIMPKIVKAAEKNPPGSTRIVNITSLSPTTSVLRWSDPNFNVINKELPEVEQPLYDLQKAWGVVDPENKSYTPIEGYNQSKVANLLFGIALNKRLYDRHGILSFGAHPGVTVTELGRNFDKATSAAVQALLSSSFYKPTTLGAVAATGLVAALDPRLGLPKTETISGKEYENYGAYMVDCQISNAARPLAVSSSEAERLWSKSEDLVKEKFAW